MTYGPRVCPAVTDECPPAVGRNDRKATWFNMDAPVTCLVPTLWVLPDKFEFEVAKLVAEGDWEMLWYDDEQCSGSPVRIGHSDTGKCIPFDQPMRAVLAWPVFNADQN